MPWHIDSHASCPASRPFAVVKDSTGEVEGCHPSRSEAEAQLAALYANESASGRSAMPEPTSAASAAEVAAASAVEVSAPEQPPSSGIHEFQTVLVIEDEPTSDGRMFAADSLTWRTLPIPLLWQRENLPRHQASVVVGRIDEIWREGTELRGRGAFDLDSPEGAEAARQVAAQFLRGVSIDAEVFADELIEEGDDMLQVITSGRIMGLTIVPFPAFPSAVIALADQAIPDGDINGRPAATTTRARLPVFDLPFAGLPSNFDAPQWIAACAAAEGANPQSPFADAYLPHHDPDGKLSRRGLKAAVSRIPYTRRRNLEQARAHLAEHFRIDLREPIPPILDPASALVASARRHPPVSWFTDPDLRAPTPITVTRDGRIYGHAALWDTCHISRSDICITPPHSRASYAYFLTGETEVADGLVASAASTAAPSAPIESVTDGDDSWVTITDDAVTAAAAPLADCPAPGVPTGPVTLGTGHAPLSASAEAATQHYDNSGLAVADVSVGEDAYGIWVSGSLRPGITEAQRAALRGSALSGDWRRIGGNLELIALLAVNVPGFPVPRLGTARFGTTQVALVAAGIPQDEPAPEPEVVPTGIPADDLLAELRREKIEGESPDPANDPTNDPTDGSADNPDDPTDNAGPDNPSAPGSDGSPAPSP